MEGGGTPRGCSLSQVDFFVVDLKCCSAVDAVLKSYILSFEPHYNPVRQVC